MRKRRTPRKSQVLLQAAINEEDLNVVFQPIVDLETHTTFGLEALVRCKTPGFESPPVLFAHAVTQGYVGRLGGLIREQAVERGRGHRLFLNIHPAELVERWVVRPEDPIFKHDHEVYLEITEAVAFSHYDTCISVIEELRSRAKGKVHLVIDDLGAGFSNLKRIVDLQPSIVKLDMALVTGIDKNPRQQTLVASLVNLCREQGATVVAEGIETPTELRAVIDAGVQFGQGYLLARPAYPIPASFWPPGI